MSKSKNNEKATETAKKNLPVPTKISQPAPPTLQEDNRHQEEQLKEYEELIHAKTDDFIDVVINLRKIKDGNLYECRKDDTGKPLYEGFGDYMEKEFGFRRAYYSRLNKAYRTYELVTDGMSEEEKKEIQVRPALYLSLSEIEENKQKEAFEATIGKKDKSIKGTDIIKWGEKNKVLKKKKAHLKGKTQSLKIFSGLATKLVGDETDETKKALSSFEERDKLVKNLKKIIELLNGAN